MMGNYYSFLPFIPNNKDYFIILYKSSHQLLFFLLITKHHYVVFKLQFIITIATCYILLLIKLDINHFPFTFLHPLHQKLTQYQFSKYLLKLHKQVLIFQKVSNYEIYLLEYSQCYYIPLFIQLLIYENHVFITTVFYNSHNNQLSQMFKPFFIY